MTNELQQVQVGGRSLAPSKIICIGRNYAEHIEELGNEVPEDMVVFCKPNSAIGEELHAFNQEPLHYESEICFIYENGHFTAVGFGLDITKRQLQGKLKDKGLPWERAKAFDGAALFSQFVEIDSISESLSVQLEINGKLVQSDAISMMLYPPHVILNELTSFMSLNNGDIVMTGTPKGVGIINEGDVFNGLIKQGNHILTSAAWEAN